MADAVKRPGVWGIDLGQCALKAIRLEEEDGQFHATAFDYIEHPKILSQPDADPDQLTREALEKFLSRNDLKGDTVAISVPGQSGLARFVKLPPVDEKKIPDIVRFEAKQQIPFPLNEVVWGFQRLGPGTASDNMILDAEIGLFAMKRDMINRALQHFKDVNIEVHYIQMAPLALCNFLAHDLLGKGAPAAMGGEDAEEGSEDKNCVVGLDIGADNSNLVITDGEKIIWQRPIPLGGNHFTRALTKDLKLTFAKAEHLKRNAVKSPDLKKILAALKPVLNDFVSEVQRSLGYFTNTHRDANILYMVGLGNAFRLPGLQKYLQEKLQLEVRKLQKIERLSGEEGVTEAPQYVENVLSFAVAHGLALQGLNSTRIYTNLLPPEIAQERAIKAKKPWAVVAAAVLLLISPPMLFGWSRALNGWANPEVEKANVSLKAVVDDAKKDDANFKLAEEDAKKYREALMKLAGGVGERLNWVHLNNFINEALPRPDGSRLVETARDGSTPYAQYYLKKRLPSGEDAWQAWKKLRDKHAKGEKLTEGELKTEFEIRKINPGLDAELRWRELKDKQALGGTLTAEEQKTEDEIRKSLVQVNIEAIAALYSENLPTEAFARSPEKFFETFLGPKAPVKVSLPTKGWVIEIRGFTYNEGKELEGEQRNTEKFIANTLVENLNDLAMDPKTDAKDHSQLWAKVHVHPQAESVLRMKDAAGAEKPRVSHVFLYRTYTDPYPQPGVFRMIVKSSIAEKMGMYGPPNYFQPVIDPADLAEGKKAPPPPRNSWRPPTGTMVGISFGAGDTNLPSGGGFNRGRDDPSTQGKAAPDPTAGDPANPQPPPTTTVRRTPRTEFVIWFVWQEPLSAGQ